MPRLRQGIALSVALFDKLLNVCAYFGAFLVFALALSICYDVFMRRVFNRPTIWATDFSEYMLLSMTFLGAAWLLRDGSHVRMTILVERMSPQRALLTNTISSIAAALVCGVLFWKTFTGTWGAYQVGTVMVRAVSYPQFIIWAVMPAGYLLLVLQSLRIVYQHVAALRKGAGQGAREKRLTV
jgi:TRAP-type C4-dicarboxylate transport system permease small subunit